jgi:hypothetical protein
MLLLVVGLFNTFLRISEQPSAVVFRFNVGSITHDYTMNVAVCGNAIPELSIYLGSANLQYFIHKYARFLVKVSRLETGLLID